MTAPRKPTDFPSDALTEWVWRDPYALRNVFLKMTVAAPDVLLRVVTEIGTAPVELIAYLEGQAA